MLPEYSINVILVQRKGEMTTLKLTIIICPENLGRDVKELIGEEFHASTVVTVTAM